MEKQREKEFGMEQKSLIQVIGMKVNGKMVKRKEEEHIIKWKNGHMDGNGIYYFISGNRYEGNWRNSKMDGKGIFYLHNGERRIGDFSFGKPIGKHVTLTKNGTVLIRNF